MLITPNSIAVPQSLCWLNAALQRYGVYLSSGPIQTPISPLLQVKCRLTGLGGTSVVYMMNLLSQITSTLI